MCAAFAGVDVPTLLSELLGARHLLQCLPCAYSTGGVESTAGCNVLAMLDSLGTNPACGIVCYSECTLCTQVPHVIIHPVFTNTAQHYTVRRRMLPPIPALTQSVSTVAMRC